MSKPRLFLWTFAPVMCIHWSKQRWVDFLRRLKQMDRTIFGFAVGSPPFTCLSGLHARLLNNLVGKTLKFPPNSGHVTIKISHPMEKIFVSVLDIRI
jgi:hypothetical protein